MADRQNLDVKTSDTASMARPKDTAQHVAAAVVQDIMNNLDPAVMEVLHSAILAQSPEVLRRVVKKLVADGVRSVDLADFYIPELARVLGDRWCVDELSFADVTIGVSRLQGILRTLGPYWSGDHTLRYSASSILLIVPQDVHHTLGAIVLGGQLRRKGCSVKLILGGKPKDVAACLSSISFDAVFISSSRGETLESLRRIVDAVKTAALNSPPVVVGGTILEVETVEALTTLTGADHATKVPEEALKLCGLLTTTHQDAPQLYRG